MKNIFLILSLSCLIGCAIVKNSTLNVRPQIGVGFAEETIDSLNFLVKFVASNHSGTSNYFFYHKIKSRGPFILQMDVRNEDKAQKKVVLHSIFIQAPSKNEEIIFGNEDGLKIQFKKATNVDGQFLGWRASYFFKQDPIEIPSANDQRISVKFVMTIETDGIRKRRELTFPFKTVLIDETRIMSFTSIYGH